MAVTRYRPIRFQPTRLRPLDLRPFQWPDLFEDWLTPVDEASASGETQPAVRVERNDDGVTVHADLPGVRREDLELSVTPDARGAVITLDAVRHLGDGEQRFRWSARIGDVDSESVTANLADGVLTLSASNRPGVVARKIEVTASEPVDTALEAAPEPATESTSAPSDTDVESD